jgi:ABC-type dipeptide/oligopeptide/nickel transport system ATPase subunit
VTKKPARIFEAALAKRESVPLLVGLMGPSGGGKTYSALRLATGIQEVVGGDIYGIDTETRRMTHYADRFKFHHVPFQAPFGSLDYLDALTWCVKKGAKVIIVDSMSHEHEGPGGLLDLHEQELDRMAGDDWGKRERVKMLAWQKPKANRRALINGLLQLDANFIFCFRAKQTAKPVKVGNKTEVVNQGFMPIAGEEFVFEQTVNCLLLPGAKGVPSWQSENLGERTMMKLPEQFKDLFAKERALDEAIGRELATWARGGEAKAPNPLAKRARGEKDILELARDEARKGSAAFNRWWERLNERDQDRVSEIADELYDIGQDADARANETELQGAA